RKRPGGTRDSSPVIHCRERGASCHESRPYLHFETVPESLPHRFNDIFPLKTACLPDLRQKNL
ncbi:MAG: hypothetical protein WBG50_19150, partial [Desulfomonilaceae bacterium]